MSQMGGEAGGGDAAIGGDECGRHGRAQGADSPREVGATLMIALDVVLVGILVTVLLEVLCANVVTSIRQARGSEAVALMNLATNPVAQMLWILMAYVPENLVIYGVAAIEAGAVVIEAALLWRLRLVRGLAGAIVASAMLNLASFVGGILTLSCYINR